MNKAKLFKHYNQNHIFMIKKHNYNFNKSLGINYLSRNKQIEYYKNKKTIIKIIYLIIQIININSINKIKLNLKIVKLNL